MKIKTGFIKRQVAGRTVVVAVGDRSREFNSMITLNGIADFIWTVMQNDVTVDQVVSAVLAEYDADEQTVRTDVEKFIGKLREAGLLDE